MRGAERTRGPIASGVGTGVLPKGRRKRSISRISVLVLGQPWPVWSWVQVKDGEVQRTGVVSC